jgi:hypothetical protein
MCRLSPLHRHTSPNQSYGTPSSAPSPKFLLSAMLCRQGSSYGTEPMVVAVNGELVPGW